jgi:N-methylhydantoinase A/oxoprolinase/acetone carboxylase beta subunit
MIHSGGGLISVETAAEFPVRLVESGPAGGAIFAADVAQSASGWRRWSAMTWAAPPPRSA